MSISKRDRMAALLNAGGLLRILEILARRPCLLVVNYHRIGSCEHNRFDDGVFSATADEFRDQVRYLRANFEILGSDELLNAAERGFALNRAAVVITFDDGYRDNYEFAFPVLRELGVPAFFFIPTEYIDSPRLPWWDRIAFILKTTSVARLSLDDAGSLELDLCRIEREQAIRRVLRHYKTAGRIDEELVF